MDKEVKNELTKKLQKEIEEIHQNPYTRLFQNILNIKQLLSKGADINSQDNEGNTLLHHVVSSNSLKAYNAYIKETLSINPPEKAKYLLDLSTILSTYLPNPFIKNIQGETPLSLTQKKKNKTDENILIAYENAYSSFESEKQMSFITHKNISLHVLKKQTIKINQR